MLDELNFESVYEEVQGSSAYSPEEKSAVTEAVLRSYEQMHEDMTDRSQFGSSGANAVCQHFLAKFASADSRERGFIFTLNQDLLVEAFGSLAPDMPGLPAGRTLARPVSLPGNDTVSAEAATFLATRRRPLTYIKLHGSFERRGANESRAIVIGTNKGMMLSEEPLLKWYQLTFREALHEKERSLLVIGYSFRDAHINDVILSAVQSAGLKLWVMSPASPDEFRAMLQGVGPAGAPYIRHGNELWQALHGYYRGSVTDYYIHNHVKLPRIGARLFEDLGFA
jgi:SIR2-like domain